MFENGEMWNSSIHKWWVFEGSIHECELLKTSLIKLTVKRPSHWIMNGKCVLKNRKKLGKNDFPYFTVILTFLVAAL